MTKALPKTITSYDLLKTFAAITMIIDHVGWYFFPEQVWFRIIGRMSFPVWLFLIGYARGRDIPPRLLIGAAILVVSTIVAGQSIMAVNILLTIALTRLCLDPLAKFALKGSAQLVALSTILLALVIPSGFVFEYGTLAFIVALLGYFLRHLQDEGHQKLTRNFALFTGLSIVLTQSVIFGLEGIQLVTLAFLTAFVLMIIQKFKPMEFASLTAKTPTMLTRIIQLCGRRTLEIYVLHLLLFKALAVYLGFEGYELFSWTWFEVQF